MQTRSRLLTTLIYPAALAVTAVAVVIALVTFVVPKVVEQLESMGQTLPLLTRIVIALMLLAGCGDDDAEGTRRDSGPPAEAAPLDPERAMGVPLDDLRGAYRVARAEAERYVATAEGVGHARQSHGEQWRVGWAMLNQITIPGAIARLRRPELHQQPICDHPAP